MKSRNKLFKVLAMFTAMSMVLVGCDGKPSISISNEDNCRVTFFIGYPGAGYTVQTVKSGETATAPSDPIRDGYTFNGWTTDYEGLETFDFESPITSDTEFYGQWSKNVNIVTFKYNTDKSDDVVNVDAGAKVSEPAEPVRDGYTFDGWFLNALCTEPYDFDSVVVEDLVLYCGWTRSAISITFNFNYTGAPTNVVVSASVNQEVALPPTVVLERDLYAFAGWYTKAFPAETDVAVDLTVGFEDDIILYAKWVRQFYAVTFNPNVSTLQPIVVRVPLANPVAVPPVFVREGYTLDATWYTDAALTTPYNLNEVKDDITIYAKWNINSYTVKFDLNYEGATGAPNDQSIKYQGLINRPANPTRDGYVFLGWFNGAGDDATEFNVATDKITSDKTLYAHWAVATSGKATVTFTYIKGGATVTHATVEVDKGDFIGADKMPNKPAFANTHTDNDYMFINWYTDAALTNEYDPNKVINNDTMIYGRIVKRNTFEAEFVNLQDMHGVGSSVELYEEAMIFSYEKIGAGNNTGVDWVSNGWYVAGLYYSGAGINFEIMADQAIEDAVLVMRVSSEFKELHHNPLTPETYSVLVNGVEFEYELPLTLPLPNTERENDPDGEKTPFEDVIISYHFSLSEGYNMISFITNNSWDYGAGTFRANAPMIDCIYIFTEETNGLTMIEYREFLNRK
ncbi:MAG TPA: InlB B-repeat-containing protein [Erysipelotrichaceae bacterium]|nr:InlB B-repeat-containing protein [Erysipelotrichaceae bacterium]